MSEDDAYPIDASVAEDAAPTDATTTRTPEPETTIRATCNPSRVGGGGAPGAMLALLAVVLPLSRKRR